MLLTEIEHVGYPGTVTKPAQLNMAMESQLCDICYSIPGEFWSAAFDGGGFPWSRRVGLQPFNAMDAAAEGGCNLCQILLASVRERPLDLDILENVPVTLSRARLNGEHTVSLGIETDDYSDTIFHRAPQPWDSLPPVKVGEQVDNLELMKTWLRNCKTNHQRCRPNQRSFSPTRLLDLQAFTTGDDIKLVSCKTESLRDDTGQGPEFLALSHCWGPPEHHPITTTTSNLAMRMHRIPFEELSHTFRDAVDITRQLHIRYLWIDSLCIVQDDDSDWAREAASMLDVYGNAYCMLAALSSADGRGGLQLVPDVQSTTGAFLDIDTMKHDSEPLRVRTYAHNPRRWREQFGEDHAKARGYSKSRNVLGSRAWTLQERILSRRSICFAKDQLLWECCELQASAQLPWASSDGDQTICTWSGRNMLAGYIDASDTIARRDCWLQIVEDYSFRSLTHQTDKLPALWGLAEQFRRTNPPGGKYLAGLWSHHFPAALLWRRISATASRPSVFIAPTWSWASIQGGVSHECLRISEPPIPSWAHGNGSAELVDSNLKLAKYFGSTRDSNPGTRDIVGIVLSGATLAPVDSQRSRRPVATLYSYIFRRSGADGEDQYHKHADSCLPGTQAFLTKNGATVGLVYPDDDDVASDSDRLFCLRVQGERYWSDGHKPWDLYRGADIKTSALAVCLILKQKPGAKDTYTRLGLARWVKESLFDGCSAQPIIKLF